MITLERDAPVLGFDTPIVTAQHKEQFETQGFFVLERVIPEVHLALLRDVCSDMMATVDAKADSEGRNRPLKYFMSVWDELGKPNESEQKIAARRRLSEFVFSPVMASITRSLLGDDVYLAFEQFVVKAAERGATFAWHQDSGYVPTKHRPFLTTWCTLDDVTEENGTVYMLPYDRAGTRDLLPHTKAVDDFDLIGYTGPDPGVPVIAPAGSIAIFSSHVLHRSGVNTTDKVRRIFLPQYSAEPVLKEDGTPFYLAEPFLKNGECVAKY